MSGPREPRYPRPESPAPDEPWWKNANTRVPAPTPPPMPAPPAPRMPAPPPAPKARNRHAKATPARRNIGQLVLLITLGVIAIAAAVVGLTVGLSKFDVLTGKVLDASKAEAGVKRVLLDREVGYSATNVSDVDCNKGNDPAIKKGATFTCDVVVDGRKRQVLVLFTDDNGTYEVDRPR